MGGYVVSWMVSSPSAVPLVSPLSVSGSLEESKDPIARVHDLLRSGIVVIKVPPLHYYYYLVLIFGECSQTNTEMILLMHTS